MVTKITVARNHTFYQLLYWIFKGNRSLSLRLQWDFIFSYLSVIAALWGSQQNVWGHKKHTVMDNQQIDPRWAQFDCSYFSYQKNVCTESFCQLFPEEGNNEQITAESKDPRIARRIKSQLYNMWVVPMHCGSKIQWTLDNLSRDSWSLTWGQIV